MSRKQKSGTKTSPNSGHVSSPRSDENSAPGAARDAGSINYYELAKTLRRQLQFKTRLVGMRLYPETVPANAIVKWLVANDYADSNVGAIRIGRKLTQYGHIYAVNEDRIGAYEFTESEQAFRFALDDVDLASNLQHGDLVAIMTDLEHRSASAQDGFVIEGLHEHCGADLVQGILALGFAWNREQATCIAQRLLDERILARIDSGVRACSQQQFKPSKSAVYRSQQVNDVSSSSTTASKRTPSRLSSGTVGGKGASNRPPYVPESHASCGSVSFLHSESITSTITAGTSRLFSSADTGILSRHSSGGSVAAAGVTTTPNDCSKRSSRIKKQVLRYSKLRSSAISTAHSRSQSAS